VAMADTDAVIYLMGPSALDRQAYRLLLEKDWNFAVTVESDFAPVAVWAAMRAKPDLVLVTADRVTPEVHDAVQMIPRLRKQTRILVASAAVDATALKDWGRCGIDGYVVKDGGVDELRPAIAAVLAGKPYFSAGVREAIDKGRDSINGFEMLSRRETELLPLLARGLTLREAASKMAVSYKTADSYRTSLLRKLGVRDRVELARLAIRERIIDP
jgi:two-component system nitrate/nitrite response regulator NarL